MRSVIRYLTIYENREKVKKYVCYLLIAIIIIIPYLAPRQYDITSPLTVVDRPANVVSFDNRRIVKDEEMTVTDAHITVLKYMYDYFRDYQVSRFVYRDSVIALWVYHSTSYGSYNDIKKIGDLLKIRFPNNNIMVVLVWDNHSVYALSEYRI